MTSIAYEQGKKAAKMGIALEDSAITSLHPDSERHSQFLAGFEDNVNQDDIDCACDDLGSICCVCEDDY
ncbi:conserved hypothetical protein [Vibrio nigripulchritudo SOn1]|uniref:Uncharacterized protein n=1 Tax=Vibrio nigripulchritudo SOn1 TaxID=1238450 RepID=A0AAV2VPV9_9VIBR|nr:hypothetical protein [Vibrio nigripulchritudo]CCO46711.1 conserved hypothetical protein [Vibrio nigripulchritudo SOn1]